jgi:hypothetical protein
MPVATLAYQTPGLATDGWWQAARLVGRLAFWWGMLRLASIIVDVITSALLGGGRFLTFGNFRSMTGALGVLFLAAMVAGAVLCITGGRRVARVGNSSGLRQIFWGAILLGAASSLPTIIQLLTFGGRGLPTYYWPQLIVSTVIGWLLPAFVAYFAWRSKDHAGMASPTPAD